MSSGGPVVREQAWAWPRKRLLAYDQLQSGSNVLHVLSRSTERRSPGELA